MNPTHLPLSSAQHQHPNMCGVLDIPKLHNVYYVEHAFEHTPQQAKSNATSCLNEQVQPPLRGGISTTVGNVEQAARRSTSLEQVRSVAPSVGT
ncbi:hypothetical protein L195_g051667 [Trifolium pratense]|uniref:Uncharacterized protein n=1 Tax=Trifolium pratense TaxID=57577 RepID=A0A2K3K0T8_TRIPR|nr:hypothetical protein L195_g051667 [Trifolium pratense]